MPDGRFLSKSIAYSEQLTRVSLAAEVLFYRLIPHADIEGRLPGDPFKLKSIVAPMRTSLTVSAIHKALVELEREGLVVRYLADGTQCLRLPGFKRHQKGLRVDREAASKLPPDPAAPRSTPELVGSTPDLPGFTRAEVEVKCEGSHQGQVTTHNTSPRASGDVDRDVEISPSPTTALPFEPALDRFLEKAPPHRRAALRSKVRMWRQGADCPPTQKPTDPVLITAMNEYADDPGNWSATHLWTFVRNAIRRYAETSTPPPANGHAPRGGRTGMDRTKSAIESVLAKEQAAHAAGEIG
jgi:hypothetical protein